MASLRQVRASLPDKHGLYARIDTCLAAETSGSGDNIRVGIIPFHSHRTEISGVLDAVLADPLASNQTWYSEFRNRLLSKDTLVKYSPNFDHTATNNTLMEYPIPFNPVENSRNTEIVEVNSYTDSIEHLEPCHLHIFISSNVKSLSNDLPSHYPNALVLDLPEGEQKILAKNEVQAQGKGGMLLVSSSLAQGGIDKLVESPANATEYVNAREQSNIDAVTNLIFASPEVHRRRLLQSIVDSGEQLVAPACTDNVKSSIEQENERMKNLRQQWSQQAHQELQTRLSASLDKWQHSRAPWWKLYFMVDDVYDTARFTLQQDYLPESANRLEYLLGSIDSFASQHNFPTKQEDGEVSISKDIVRSQNQLLTDYGVDLHNKAIKLLTSVLFGIQLPTVIVPALGMYFFDYSFYSMGSIMALGIVMGFRQLQKSWLRATDFFKRKVLEEARQVLGRCEKAIWSRWEAKVLDQQEAVMHQKTQLTQLQAEIDKAYSKHD